MSKRTWILGALDPEMEMIEKILTAAGENFVPATKDGKRVHPGNAYSADPVEAKGELILVECQPQGAKGTVVDHHRPGDPGYGKGPEDYFLGSSIGQVLTLLGVGVVYCEHDSLESLYHGFSSVDLSFAYIGQKGVGPGLSEVDEDLLDPDENLVEYPGWLLCHPREILTVAAADHCLSAAYAEQCLCVRASDVAAWRVKERAKFQKRPEFEVAKDIETAAAELKYAHQVELASGVFVKDMRRDPPYPELPEAACRVGAGYISGPLAGPDGKKKITCSGNLEQVKAFMEVWAPKEGLTGVYGDPARGFAGGYLD
jgi:hypothetical protein